MNHRPRATRSDFIAQVSLSAYKNWNVEAGIQWNPEDTRSERSQFRLQYRPAGDRVVNLGYRSQRDRLEQAELSGAWPIGKSWNAFGRVVYSLRDSETLEQFAGFEYKACCFAPARGGAALHLQPRGPAGNQLLPAAGTERDWPVSEHLPTLSWNAQFGDTRRKLPPGKKQLHDFKSIFARLPAFSLCGFARLGRVRPDARGQLLR